LCGLINAVDPITGAVLGHLMDAQGKAIANPGLWALKFRTGFTGTDTTVDPNALYFSAGIVVCRPVRWRSAPSQGTAPPAGIAGLTIPNYFRPPDVE